MMQEASRSGKSLPRGGLLAAVCLCAALAGCEANKRQRIGLSESLPVQQFGQAALSEAAVLTSQPASRPAKPIVLPDYRLRIGDKLEIIYHVRHEINPLGYRLKIEDIVSIEFPFQPQLDQVRTVQSDGKIHLLLVGPVRVYGMTVEQVQRLLTKLYSKYLKDPVLTVTFKKSNIQISELKKAITTAPRGQSRLVPIKPDGKIDLPYIAPIIAYGKTVEELTADVNRAYAEAGIPEMYVTVQINYVAPQKFFVFGEVWRPGVVVTDTPMTLSQAIAAAGGATPRAEKHKVLLIRRWGLPLPEGMIIDLEEMYDEPLEEEPDISLIRADPWLADADIIYVPPNSLAKFDDWVDLVFTKGIRSILPYSFSVGLTFGYDIRSAPTTVRTKTVGGPNVNLQILP